MKKKAAKKIKLLPKNLQLEIEPPAILRPRVTTIFTADGDYALATKQMNEALSEMGSEVRVSIAKNLGRVTLRLYL